MPKVTDSIKKGLWENILQPGNSDLVAGPEIAINKTEIKRPLRMGTIEDQGLITARFLTPWTTPSWSTI
jgi:hypothetical protein